MKYQLKLKLFFIFCCFCFFQTNGQQSSLYTQYMFNGLIINPAYAGSSEALNVTLLGRKQWSGIDGAPITSVLSAHAPVKNQKMGLGMLLSNDRISIFNQSTISAIYSYRIRISDKKVLSFGLQGGMQNYRANYTQLTSKVDNDPAFSGGDVSSWNPSFGAGLYYNTDKFYLGLSAPQLTSNIMSSKAIEQRNIYFLSYGYVFKLSNDIKIKPNGLVRYQSGNNIQFDFNTNVLFRETLWAGVSYRTSNMLCFLLQINVTDQLRIGYSYDSNLGGLSSFNSGSHEMMLNYLFSFSKSKVVSPRYF